MLVSTMTTEPDTASGHTVPSAACAPLAPLLSGPRRRARVVAATSTMLAVRIDEGVDGGPELVVVATPDAVVLPCSMTVGQALPALPCGAPAAVGDGHLDLPGGAVVPARWRPVRAPAVTRPARCAARAAGLQAPWLDPSLLDRAEALALAFGSGAAFGPAVDRLLGFGPGLTPAGDDVLAGALVAARALGHAKAGRLASAVDASRPFERTSSVSAGLLRYAARGLAVAELTALLMALDSAGGDVATAHARLLRVGHTSGAALFLGVRAAFAAVAGPRTDGSTPR